MIVNGKIIVNAERKTVTIYLDNGSNCFDHYVNGVARFLSDEINILLEGTPINWGNVKMNVHELFPRINEVYTPEGVSEIEEASQIIERMAAVLPLSDLLKLLTFHDRGNSRLTYGMIRHIQEVEQGQ